MSHLYKAQWEKDLIARFPFLYRHDYLWPTQRREFNFQCQEGWKDILWELSLAIEKELNYGWFTNRFAIVIEKILYPINQYLVKYLNRDYSDWPINYFKFDVMQVKEKFGTLCYYYHARKLSKNTITKIERLIAKARQLTATTCDVCGAEGTMMNNGGWMRVRCQPHEDWRWDTNDPEVVKRQLEERRRRKIKKFLLSKDE